MSVTVTRERASQRRSSRLSTSSRASLRPIQEQNSFRPPTGPPGRVPNAPPSVAGAGSSSTAIGRKPWEAPSVAKLTSKLGKDPNIQPMVIEGPAGTVLAAVGEPADHHTAGDVLAQVHAQRIANGVPMPSGPQRRDSNIPERVFGAVYEYRDSFGRPRVVGDTGSTPEERFRLDRQEHQAINNLVSYQGGTPHVVWAGTGTFPIGQEEMATMRTAVASSRAARNNVEKLSGPKPYSRHGY
ncbi:hypothetical protein CYMTET_52333 [Cymbomonas tetramitiformis]|uniref:Uncharacterized protein n=1 Tax=Cymbomonas tetramitiformis TaxID=36881 RepID=A0AAE0BJF1_9CHLO|nr:hypothetical protein CYMTET_52333 [Cymbomonas tetramitiformis]